MKRKITKILKKAAVGMLAVVMLSGTALGSVPSLGFQAGALQVEAATKDTGEVRATVKSGILNLHSQAHDKNDEYVIKKMRRGQSVTILEKGKVWYYVKCGKLEGYCMKKYLKIQKTDYEKIIKYGKRFLGNRYVWGGTSLRHGTDCSGYTMRIYQHFGYRIPRTSAQQRHAGIKVHCLKEAQPGDLICYYGHVAIYLGNDRIMHAKGRRYGIVITKGVRYRRIASIRRIL